MKVAVTGGSGFIGAALIRRLTELGHEAEIYDHATGWDVRELTAMPAPDAIIHLAGMLGTHELFDVVAEAIDVNMGGTAHVLEQARRHSARYVGITMPPVFPSVYTATKLGAGHLERAFHHTYGVPVSRVRAFNAYGPGQKHGAGHPQKILPTFATEAWAGRPIPIWGDGEQTVDLIHTDDLARMLVDALDYGDDVTFDGGTGVPVTVNELARFVLALTGSQAGITRLPMRRGEIPTRIVATGEGWDRLTWRPELDWDQVEEAVRWYRPL